MATPSGKVQCQPRKENGAESGFWVMKTSNRIRMRKPRISDVHRAPARVNCAAGSAVGGTVAGAAGVLERGLSGEAGVSLLIGSSLSDKSQNETNHAGN